ncbi:MAG: hypothetical protein Q8L55_14070 [Phycisphaerales bacterium]|nr:hypothetical protein [Phycisphaerales bacterium]
MNTRCTYILSLVTAAAMAGALGGCKGSANPPSETGGQMAVDTLSTEERFFAGRWRVDMEKFSARLEKERLAGRPSADAAMGVGLTDMMFFDLGEDRSLAWTGGTIKEGWKLDQGRVVIDYAGTPGGMVLSRCGDTICVTGPKPDERLELVNVPRGKPIDPATVPGEWAIDVDASARATVASLKQMTAAMERITGKPAAVPAPDEEQIKTYLRRMSAPTKDGRSGIRFIPGTDPRHGTVDMGEKGNNFVTRYEVYKDLLLISTPSGGPDKTWTAAMPVVDGALTWPAGGQTLLYRRK